MLPLSTSFHAWVVSRAAIAARRRDDTGQTTAEYALVLVAAAVIAVMVIAWATKTDRIGKLFDFVVDNVQGRVK